MKIIIETIPHDKQRYETVGDWFWDTTEPETLHVKVSRMSNWKNEAAVALHEMFEALWCKAASVDEEDVMAFDKYYEDNRSDNDDSEPGDAPTAPYREGHQIATKLEKQAFAAWAWAEYDKEVTDL